MSILNKVSKLRTIVRDNGGIFKSIVTIFRTDDLRTGTLVGEDKFGNKYYENNDFFLARNRWIIYSNRYGWDYDASQVPAEWHRWLHHICDETPVEKPPVARKWIIDHTENTSLDPTKKYIPYSTTKPKVEAWDPTTNK